MYSSDDGEQRKKFVLLKNPIFLRDGTLSLLSQTMTFEEQDVRLIDGSGQPFC